MKGGAEYLNLSFTGAINWFRQKLNLATERWNDIWGEMHTRAFTVAGAASDALLDDLRSAIDKAISTGTTLNEFRRDFDAIVQKFGWSYKGTRGWRTAVIYDTNLTTAYSAGRYRQATTEAVAGALPYFRYMRTSSANPRKEHLKWDNLVLAKDDPFWNTHMPPNGWGCKCGVQSLSERGLEKLKKRMEDQGRTVKTVAPEIEMVEYLDKKTGQIRKAPKGIDPGWDYNPGKNPWPAGKL